MSVRRPPSFILPSLLLGVCGVVLAADNDLPEADFLEYLGSWEESDDEWMLFDIDDERLDDEQLAAEADKGINDERIDPALQSKESTENDDET